MDKAIKHLCNECVPIRNTTIVVYGGTHVFVDANLRSSSLVLLRMFVFTLLHSTMVLIIYGLMHLNLLEGVFATLFRPLDEVSRGCVRSMGSS